MATETDVKIPDIGGASGVDVIELLVKVGDQIEVDTPLVTLESDKASMEIPSPTAGVVKQIKVKLGDKVSEGDVILSVETSGVGQQPAEKTHDTAEMAPIDTLQKAENDLPKLENQSEETSKQQDQSNNANFTTQLESTVSPQRSIPNASQVFAGPAVRRMAHLLGVDLTEVLGTARKERISKADVEAYVKHRLSQPTSGGVSVPSAPAIDFAQFGSIETKPLNKIKRLTGQNVHRAWVTIPHVTQFDEADITELEAFRKAEASHAEKNGYKLTLLAFMCKVVSKALSVFPTFNASLDVTGQNLILKQYVHIGIAVETPNGLVVPVIRDVNHLSVGEIAKEMGRLSQKAREKGLMPQDMSGGCFTISSLGGIGGTAFTPIVNAPEVAILGLSRSVMKPVYQNGTFVPRLMLPLSLSYDHRVIDGAEAARFTRYLSDALSDIRKIIL